MCIQTFIKQCLFVICVFHFISCQHEHKKEQEQETLPLIVKKDTVIHDQWFNGFFSDQPAINAHEQIIAHSDGSRSTIFETTIAISRSLFGFESILKIVQRRKFMENADGIIQGFVFEDDENGKRISAIGKIEGKIITATITNPYGSRQQSITIPDDIELMGTLRSQEFLNQHAQNIGDSLKFSGVEMISGKISLVHMSAEYVKLHSNGDKSFKIIMDLMPMFAVNTIINKHGHTREVSMPMGFITINIRAANGPMKIEAAKLDITKMIQSGGGMPQAGDNAYQISKESIQHISPDPFQTLEEDTVRVSNNSAVQALSDQDHKAYLAQELQLEIDNPELQQWVITSLSEYQDATIADQAEVLRLKVRSHITTKDLSQGDASALETFNTRRGDCTEHANLLCAALRIADIPSRTEVGFVFAPSVQTWVGHAWVSAFDASSNTWIHLDAAYPGIQRSNYIKTASTAGGDSTGKAMARGMGALLGQKIIILKP
ncbi:MAG: transglutaminase domain-containing protein [Planctomycetes bacterium]|nr:transglutaminase domain-containing protein [Planctomycetota bacterium]